MTCNIVGTTQKLLQFVTNIFEARQNGDDYFCRYDYGKIIHFPGVDDVSVCRIIKKVQIIIILTFINVLKLTVLIIIIIK